MARFVVSAPDPVTNRRPTLRHGKPRPCEFKSACPRSAVSIPCQVDTLGPFGAFKEHQPREAGMAKGEQRSNRETKKPKKEKIKTIAAAPSQKGVGNLQSEFGSGKKK
jgi:hypothetical protein